MVAGGMDRQRAPAAADVEQGHPRAQPQLATHMFQLGLLGLGQVLVATREIRAGIHHGRVEPARIEVVGDVVVVLDRLLVRASRMLGDPVGQVAESLAFVAFVGQRRGHFDDVADIALDVDVALDERGAERIEAGIDQPPGGRHVAQRNRDDRVVPEIGRRAVP